jgi:hypothetical protein
MFYLFGANILYFPSLTTLYVQRAGVTGESQQVPETCNVVDAVHRKSVMTVDVSRQRVAAA